MRDHSNHREVSREQAVELLLDACEFEPRTESAPVDQAFGRVLAADITARLDMPNCLTCCMDSVAVHWSDFENGMPDTTCWQRGKEWEFANTGIGMPEGFDTAIVIEHVILSEDETSISFTSVPSKRFAGTRPAGSRMHEGDVLAKAGETVTPLLASHIASGGNTHVDVIARPLVGFIPTGNELVNPGNDLPRGKNYETNSLLVSGKVAAWGGTCLVHDIVPDDRAKIMAAVKELCETCDIVVLNAGSSKGSDDWNVEALDEIGTVLYHETNHGPGHHSSGAVVDGTPVVGISGPPGGAAFTTDFYLLPLMKRFFTQPVEPKTAIARLAADFPVRKRPPANAAVSGEKRPSIVKSGKLFYGIKQLRLSMADDGTIEAVPLSSSHPGPQEANTADAYYALCSDTEENPPKAGDLIRVELRPRQL